MLRLLGENQLKLRDKPVIYRKGMRGVEDIGIEELERIMSGTILHT